jgi:hypothetical protein
MSSSQKTGRNFEDVVLAILTAGTDDLRELASLAGADPTHFYKDANFRKADLRAQDINRISLGATRLWRLQKGGHGHGVQKLRLSVRVVNV